MSDLIIKPSGTGASLKIQNPSGTNKIVMNSSGEMETWDVKGKKNHKLENLKQNLTNVEKQLKEKQNEV